MADEQKSSSPTTIVTVRSPTQSKTENPGNVRITLNDDQLKGYLDQTNDALPYTVPEYLRSYRLYRGLRQKDVAGLLDVELATVKKWEQGISLPSKAVLAAMPERLFDRHPTYYATFEDIYIQERLALAASNPNSQQTASAHRNELPTVYWKNVIDAFMNPKSWEAASDKPVWATQIKPIVTRSDYLNAMNQLLECNPAETIPGLTKQYLKQFENGTRVFQKTSSYYQPLMDFYQAKQAAMDADAPTGQRAYQFFSQAKMEETPEGEVRERKLSGRQR